jgi:2-aminobenzoate-CoA ligase
MLDEPSLGLAPVITDLTFQKIAEIHAMGTAILLVEQTGVTGTPVPGYEAKIVDKDLNEVPRGTVGRLAVRGPTGCRYLADVRQREYVWNGWNLTGDVFSQDDEGYFHFVARNDDMIISAGYKIAGPEVEAVLPTHEAWTNAR